MSENDVRKGKSFSQPIQFNRIEINLENRMSPPFKSRYNNAKRTKRPPSPFYNIGVTSTNKLESGDIVGEKVGKFRQIGSESSSNRISEIDDSLGRNIFTSSAIKDRNERMSPPPLKNGNKFITSPLINWGMSPPPGQIGEIEKNYFSRMSPPPPINSGKKIIPPRIDGGMIPPLVDQNSCQIGENHFSRMSPPPPSSSNKILTSPRIDRGMIPPPLVDQDNSGQIRKMRGNCKIFDREEKEMENRFSWSIKIQNGRMSPPPVRKNRDSSSFNKKITTPLKKIQNGRMNPPPLQKNRDSSSFDKITPPSIKIQNGGMNPPPLTKNLDSSSSNTNFTKIQNGGMSPPPLKKNSSNSKTNTNQIFTPHLADWGMSPPPSSSSDKILIPPVTDRGMISPPLVDQYNSRQVRKMTENCKIFDREGKKMENRFPPSIEIQKGGMGPPPLKKNRDSSSFNKIFTPPLAYWGMSPPLLVYRNNSRQVREMPQSPEIFEREGKRIENHFSPIKTQSERMSQTFSGRSNKILIPPLIDSGMIPPPLVDQNNSGQVGKNRQIFEREGNKAENHFSSINIQNGGMSSPPLKKNSNRSTFKTNIDKILTPPLSDWGMSPPPIVDQNGRLQHRKIWENRFSSTTTIQNRGMSLPPFSSFKPNTKKFFTPILVNPGMSSPPPVYRNNSFQVKRKWDNRKMSNREGWQGANHENRQYDRMSSPFLVNNRDSTNQIRPPPPQDQRDLLQDRKLWGNRFTSTIHNQGDIMSPPPIADQNDRLQHRKIRENRFSSTTTIQNRGMSLPPFSSFKANNKKFFTPILVNPGMSSPPPVYRNNSYQFKRKWDNRKMLNREGWQGANHENRVSSSRNRQYDRMSSPFLVNNGDSTNQIRPPPPQDQRDLLQNRKLWQNRFTSTIHNQGDIMSQPLLMKNPYCRSFNANTDKIFTSAVINEKNENDRMSQPSRNKIENPPSSKTTLNQYRKTSEHHQPAPNRNNLTNSNITVSCNFDSAFSPESFRRNRPPSSNFNPCRVILRKTNESRINPNNLDAIITPSSGDFADYTSIALPLGGVNLDGILTPSSADFADYTSNVLPLGGVNRHNDIDERFHPNFDYTLRRISDNRIIVSLPTSCFVYPPIVSPRVLSNDNPPFNNMSDYIPDFNCHSAVFDESSSKDKDLTATKRKYGKKNNSIEVPAHFPLNQYAHADGPNDSSSDEEEEEEGVKPAPKKACRRTKKIQSESSKYSPLRVKFGSPSKSNLQAHLNRPSIPFAQRDRQIPINDDHRSPRYKRKLDFSRSSHLNRTETEEKLACSYKPIRKQSAIYSPIDGAQTSSRSLRKSEVTPIDSDEDGRNEIDLCSVLTPYQKRPEDDITEIDRNLGSEFSENRPTIASKDVKIIGEEIPESSMWIGSSSITPYRKGRGDVEEASGGQSSSNTSTGNFKDLGGRDKLQISGFTSNGRSQNKKGAVITSEDDVKIITADILGSSIVIGSSLITPYQKGRGDVEEASGLDVDIVVGGELKQDGQSSSNKFKDVAGRDKLKTSGFTSNRSSQNEEGAVITTQDDLKIITDEIRESSILIGSSLITPYQKGRGDVEEASGLDVDIVGGGELKKDGQSASNNLQGNFKDVEGCDKLQVSGFVSNRSSQNEKGAAIHSENDVKIINEEIRESSILIGSYLITPYQKGRGDLQEASGLDVDIVGGGELKEGDQSPSNNLLTPFRHDVKSSDSSGASGSDDIFSPTFDDLPTDLAEIYDVQKNFIPQAGTSKLSRKSINPQSSDSNTSTPQHPSSDSNRIKSSIREQIESSGSEVTPYQKEHKLTYNLTRFEYVDDDHLPNEGDARIIVPKFNPPSRDLIESTLGEYNIKEVSHQEPFYSDAKDVTGPMEIGLRVLRIPGNKIGDFPDFRSDYSGIEYYRREILAAMYPGEKITGKEVGNYKMSFCRSGDCLVTPIGLPPRRGDVELWLRKKLDEKSKGKEKEVVREKKKIFIACSPGADDDTDDSMTISPCTPLDETIKNDDDEMGKSPIRQKRNDSGQITGVTLDRTNNFAISSHNLQEAKSVREYLHLTVMCVEVIVETRGDFKPNPAHDTVKAIVYTIFNDVPEDDPHVKRSKRGCFLLDNIPTSPSKLTFSILNGIVTDPNEDDVKVTKSEEDLFKEFIQFFLQSDPDILMGYEVEMLSWGYLIERGYILNLNLIGLLARIKSGATKNRKVEDGDQDLTIPGRIILDFWRLLRHEIALQSYTFENIAYHVLHERAPVYSFKQLTNWWNQPSGLYRGRVLNYYYYRVEAILRITERLDLIGRTSELAKLFGIQFYEVLSRGSQFRVESMMLRLAKPLNYIAVSPGVQQKVKMKAPEFLPLIMEPESKFYADPVIVLDFQSLYPSMIIAYNLCFSTCLGRIEHLGGNGIFEFGAGQLKIARKYVKSLLARDLINITPCGVAFASKSVREGVLPRMLQEILDTRLMVKKSLKDNKGNKILEKVLDARQLGLKLIANVTYGYTAANFSGRMPCIEVADSVVSKGRETLQRAINLVEKTPRWGARVVYGDTDSMFVLVAGKSREDAFKIGAEIAEAVGEDNPSPVKLKLEKVFHPCILQTKKRYVGYIYESPSQERPEYCAKGIETVRRDGCPAVSKMLEKCLKILFDTRDVSLVRQYVTRQFAKILSGRIGIQDLTFAKEYRGSSGYRPGAYVPALELARKWLAVDKRSEPRRSERVPYVIINGPPGLPLIRLVRSPRELIADPSLRPNALYYITKVIIPPINRCFLLIGADLNNWFNEMPRKQFQYLHTSSPVKGKKSTISQYFSTRNCVVCGEQSKDGLCDRCISKSQATSVVLHQKIHLLEKKHYETRMICESCSGNFDRISCISLDCPVYYKRIQTEKEVQQAPFVRELIRLLPDLDF